MMNTKTINERLFDSIIEQSNGFKDINLDKTKLKEISKRLIDYVREVERNETRTDSAAKSLENDIYKLFIY